MQVINKNWTDDDGNHAGGQSCGSNFTIVWQRGPLNESGRNGAFLLEVLDSCLSWLCVPCQSHRTIYGFGFTIIIGSREIPEEHRLATLKDVLGACLDQIQYFQGQPKFKCEENQLAISEITAAIEALPDIDRCVARIQVAISTLLNRRDRREKAGTLGTHKGEA